MKKLSIKDAKQIDIVDYLASMGIKPAKTRGIDFWYHSPLRLENTPSFKVNRKANIWYDHGTGLGGNLVDFGILYHKCSLSDLLTRLNNPGIGSGISFQQQANKSDLLVFSSAEKEKITKGKIVIVSERTLSAKTLLTYLEERQIPIEIARSFCKEVDFMLYNKQHTAIGFRNDAGGYELRNSYFKGSSSPKTSLFIDNHSDCVSVFEGFFNFLSYRIIEADKTSTPNNYLILNSLAFFQQQRPTMEKHKQVNLYLDRDNAGIKCTEAALKISPKYKDQSELYSNHNDLNDWLVRNKNGQSLLVKRDQQQIIKQIKSQGYGRI